MILTHHVADDAGGLLVGLVRREAVFIHRVENAPVHRLQPVAHIGQSPAHDHAHGVIEIAFLHLLFDGDERNFTGIGGRNHAILVVFVSHGIPSESPSQDHPNQVLPKPKPTQFEWSRSVVGRRPASNEKRLNFQRKVSAREGYKEASTLEILRNLTPLPRYQPLSATSSEHLGLPLVHLDIMMHSSPFLRLQLPVSVLPGI